MLAIIIFLLFLFFYNKNNFISVKEQRISSDFKKENNYYLICEYDLYLNGKTLQNFNYKISDKKIESGIVEVLTYKYAEVNNKDYITLAIKITYNKEIVSLRDILLKNPKMIKVDLDIDSKKINLKTNNSFIEKNPILNSN